ncbi:MAG: hypothetical protein ACK559_38320, partial [bacterium]
ARTRVSIVTIDRSGVASTPAVSEAATSTVLITSPSRAHGPLCAVEQSRAICTAVLNCHE